MRGIILLLVIVYLVGVGVELAPTIQGKWNDATASQLTASIVDALPDALTWPAKAYRSLTGNA
jgi:hypothetical protein